ncbi:SDR family oxidoreductase [Actinoplanes sp. CA-030573]|uniref:SDR family oxidoreductase n=1 Tax=Actinoplanes sp. CA-030573 TaxID=3239898 RepID=UPI003D907751
MGLIVVSGATGRLGGRVALRLGGDLRLLVRDPARAPSVPGAQVAVAEYADLDAMRSALRGASTVLMVSGAETPERVAQHRTFVDAAVAEGVGHLVYTSFAGAAPDATFTLARDHWATEQYIRASGLEFTFLRDNLYADFLPLMAGPDGVIRGPAGDGRAAVVVQDDIADAAVAVLRSPVEHVGPTYDLTGPSALSLTEAAAIISAATGREVRYRAETIEEAYASRERYQAPRWQVDAWVSTYTAIAAGELGAVTGDVAALTGHPATSLAELLARG